MRVRSVYVATASGRVPKPVVCESCDTAFVYSFQRTATGAAEGAPFYDPEARDAANDFATNALEEQLRHEWEPTPCPKCGIYQPPMVEELRRRHLLWPMRVGLALLGLGLFLWIIRFSGAGLTGLFLRPPVYFLAPGAALVLARFLDLKLRFDPNRDAGKRAGSPAPGVQIISREEYRELMKALERGPLST